MIPLKFDTTVHMGPHSRRRGLKPRMTDWTGLKWQCRIK